MIMGKLVSIKETAQRFGLTEQTLRNWISNGYIEYHEVGDKAKYIDEDTIMALQDTVEDIKRQQAKLEKLRDDIRYEHEVLRKEREEESTRRRYMNMMVVSAFRSGFFVTILRLLSLYGSLSDREVYFLIDYLNGYTLEAMMNKYGVSRERARQIVEKAIRKSSDLTKIETKFKEIEDLQADNTALKGTVAALEKSLAIQSVEADVAAMIKDMAKNEELIKLFSKRLVECNISIRALNCLKAKDIETIGDLVQCNRHSLLEFRNFGKKSLTELDDFLDSLNLTWGMDLSKVYSERVKALMNEDKG